MAEKTVIVDGAPLKVAHSEKYELSIRDATKGFVMAMLMALLTGAYKLIDSNSLAFDWHTFKPIVLNGLGAGVGYLIKNFFTESRVIVSQADEK